MAITQVDTIAALRQESPGDGVRFVKGHTTAGDPGAGTFEWVSDPGGGTAWNDNDGTVINPDNYAGLGRWIRQVDVRGAVHPEWWGVTGDGTTADYNRLKKCFESIRVATLYPKKPKVVFLAKTYLIKGELQSGQYTFVLDLEEGEVVEGQGIDRTILAARTEDGVSAHKIAVIRGGRAGASEQDNIVIRDLTIDCGFNESTTQRTRQAIALYGQSSTVERVKVINFGVGWDNDHQGSDRPGECFPIFLSTLTGGGRIGIIRDCEVTEPGLHADLHTDYPWPEITALTVMGRGKENNQPVLGVGGGIFRNRVHDIPKGTITTGAYQPSSVHAITVAACRGTEVADNEVINCDGSGVYIVSWTDEDVVVRNNRLINVNIGVNVGVAVGEMGYTYNDQTEEYEYVAANDLVPSHTGMRIVDNVIVLGKVKTPISELSMIGISAYISSFGNLSDEDRLKEVAITRMKDVTASQNYVHGLKIEEAGETKYPAGVRLFLNEAVFEDLDVENNTLEIPDPDDSKLPYQSSSTSAGFNTPYENALVFWPQHIDVSAVAERTRNARLHGNRNHAGQDMRLKVLQWQDDPEDPEQLWYPPVRVWREFSDRLSRHRSPLFDTASRCHYDEFLGAVPKSALGWVDASTGDAQVVAEPADQVVDGDRHPGVVRLQAGSSVGVPAVLQSSSAAICLGGNVTHVIEFGVKRSETASSADNYQVRMGLVRSVSSNEGVYFNVDYNTYHANAFLGWARSSTHYKSIIPLSSGYAYPDPPDPYPGWIDHTAAWHVCRIEVVPNVADSVTLAARFYWDQVLIGEARNDANGSPIPLDALYVVFKVNRLSVSQTPRWLHIDYFQHQVYKV